MLRKPFGTALLPSEGLNARRATLHVFDHSEVVTLPLPGGKPGEATTGLAHFYRCTETDSLRRWGFDMTFAKDNGAN